MKIKEKIISICKNQFELIVDPESVKVIAGWGTTLQFTITNFKDYPELCCFFQNVAPEFKIWAKTDYDNVVPVSISYEFVAKIFELIDVE